MLIRFVEIANFRKLKAVRLDLTNDTTLLVGANNSGKTTAMDALRQFLTAGTFHLSDFTLSNLPQLRAIGERWTTGSPDDPSDWDSLLPSLDVWIESSEPELHRATQLLPVIDEFVGLVGVRLRVEPTNIDTLRASYVSAHTKVQETLAAGVDGGAVVELWPVDFIDFLQRELPKTFRVSTYTLDPTQIAPAIVVGGATIGVPATAGTVPSEAAGAENVSRIQSLSDGQVRLDSDPLNALIRVDVVNAQRGLGNSKDVSRLSQQVSNYYETHLDPSKSPTVEDLVAIAAMQDASKTFDQKLSLAFRSPLDEIAEMGYPGGLNPRVVIRTTLNLKDGLRHSSVLKYKLDEGAPSGSEILLELPENLNGLGYQNLVLMMFTLLGFREARLKSGKASALDEPGTTDLVPIHLVLVEEPEAHLHAQVQQVFIRRAFETLRPKGADQEILKNLTSQLVVSSHSPHIAHELDFAAIRYFRRLAPAGAGAVPLSIVQSLAEVFGKVDDTSKFVSRYIKADHCNLFFADAAIIVEGAAERILLPHLISSGYRTIHNSYVQLLEIGGAHAHRLRGLIELMGIPVLVVTDIDAVGPDSTKQRPKTGQLQTTSNPTLKKWMSGPMDLDTLANLSTDLKISASGSVRFAYQTPADVVSNGTVIGTEIPSTFEDAIAMANVDAFRTIVGDGLVAKFKNVVSSSSTATDIAVGMFDELKSGDKAKFALDLLWAGTSDALSPPTYLAEGLEWLAEKLFELPLVSSVEKSPDLTIENPELVEVIEDGTVEQH